jgi:nicotinate-nucleotide adenylyltransferase
MKIGILGGTFNPVHIGHLILAEWVRDYLRLDRVIFIPCNRPPHKFNNNLLDSKVRLGLLKKTLAKDKGFSVSDIEIKRKGLSFTVDTLKALKKKHPKDRLFLIIGSDLLKSFNAWKDPKTIKRLAKVVVVLRQSVKRKKGFIYLSMPKVEISSSLVRKRIKENKSIKYLVSKEVRTYLKKNKRRLKQWAR